MLLYFDAYNLGRIYFIVTLGISNENANFVDYSKGSVG